MSHEIRTPMNGVIGMTELLLDTELTTKQREFAATIHKSGGALLRIINDILDFSKVEAGYLQIDRHPFELRTCIQECVATLAFAAAAKQLGLRTAIAPEIPAFLVGDAARLRQILLNLIGNAIKFTEQGQVVVAVDATDGADPVTIIDSQLRLHFQVRDTGIGIPADRMDRLFKSFSQVDAATTRRYGGTGLGLAISLRLAELMGGRMWVESQVDVGSIFHFELVCRFMPAPAQPVAPLASVTSLSAANPTSSTTAPAATLSCIDAAAWQRLSEMVGGDKELLIELCTDHLANNQILLERLQKSSTQRDYPALQRAAQSMQKSATTVGAMQLAEICQQLVQAATWRNETDLLTAMFSLEHSYQDVSHELERRLCALQELSPTLSVFSQSVSEVPHE